MRADKIEAEFPHLKEYPVFSAAWYRAFRAAHLEKYPNSDRKTRLNLDEFVYDAEEKEREDGR